MIELYTVPAGIPDEIEHDRPVVVLDIFRASTSIAAALNAGASRIYFAGSIAEAEAIKAERGGDVIMAGERKGYRIEGYDLGNSPREMTPDILSGRDVIFNSTNGTKLLRRFENSQHVIVGSFVCLDAVVTYVHAFAQDPIVCCAGTVGKFSGEDTLAAGMIISHLHRMGRKGDDASDFARRLVENHPGQWREWAIQSKHGCYLASIGLAEDLEYCTELNRFSFMAIKEGEAIVRREM
ncbi:MAG: 2-phosphosulfolactate phosphatase [Candidatus Zixiibacteriota bacterium]